MSQQFDVYRNPVRGGREQRPYVIDIQHEFLADMPTRVVMPLVVPEAIRVFGRLNPSFVVEGRRVLLSPTEPFSLSRRYLKTAIVNLGIDRERLVAALDLVFTGV